MENIKQLNRQMAKAAKESDWEKVESLASQRQTLIEALFSTEQMLNQAQATELAQLVESSDQSLKKQLKQNRAELISSGASLQKTHRALQAYQENNASSLK